MINCLGGLVVRIGAVVRAGRTETENGIDMNHTVSHKLPMPARRVRMTEAAVFGLGMDRIYDLIVRCDLVPGLFSFPVSTQQEIQGACCRGSNLF